MWFHAQLAQINLEWYLVGKYKNVKMAFVNLANERDMYLNFNTESTALCLESLG